MNFKFQISNFKFVIFSMFAVFCFQQIISAQVEQPPAPSAPRAVKIPPVQSKKLPNGLTVTTVERKNVPLVTVSLLIRSGAAGEAKDGLADLTASLLTKGTKTRTATQIAEEMEFLGGDIEASANWNSTVVSINVASDKLERALAIMSDVVLNPTFAPKEIALYKSQTIDELTVALKQPSSLANFVASRYTFGEHNAVGTPESLNNISQADISGFYSKKFVPSDAVLIFAGDITNTKAKDLTQRYFGSWKTKKNELDRLGVTTGGDRVAENALVRRMLVIDLPNSGQAAVTYSKKIKNLPRMRQDYFFPSMVANTVLGGGYSARLNQEIRIKRGLSYGAGSSLNWREYGTNFATRTQTKNVSAAEVAELVATEINKLSSGTVEAVELSPRKLTLTGDFGRDLETTGGLAEKLVELYTFNLDIDELNSYMTNVQSVSAEQVKEFASENFKGGDIIIVGDAKVFMDDLKKRFPNQKIEVIAANDLDLNRDDLRKFGKAAVK